VPVLRRGLLAVEHVLILVVGEVPLVLVDRVVLRQTVGLTVVGRRRQTGQGLDLTEQAVLLGLVHLPRQLVQLGYDIAHLAVVIIPRLRGCRDGCRARLTAGQRCRFSEGVLCRAVTLSAVGVAVGLEYRVGFRVVGKGLTGLQTAQ